MSQWQDFAPAGGWGTFTNHAALSEALWTQLPSTDWHYLNFAADSSIWESRQDASMVRTHYKDERFIEFAVQEGLATEALQPLISRFQLVSIPSSSDAT
jgi:hypothetical protein